MPGVNICVYMCMCVRVRVCVCVCVLAKTLRLTYCHMAYADG